MTRKLFAACLVLLAHAAVFAQQPTTTPPTPAQPVWEKFTSPEGRFSILMPGKPAPEKQTSQSPIGPYTTYLFTGRGNGQIFLVGWVDYDPKFTFDPQKELEANRDNFIKGVKGRLTGATTPIKLGTYNGIEFTAESEQANFRSRVYIVGKRPYQLIAVTMKGAAESPETARFFSSFALTPAR
jgi:hypothetical protein